MDIEGQKRRLMLLVCRHFQHSASLVIAQKTKFDPTTNLDIPIVYFNFATYETMKKRINDARLLTDYIGRVEANSLRSTSTGKMLRKTLLQDQLGTEVEITLWPEMRHLIGDEVTPGHIVAVTSTRVTEHNGACNTNCYNSFV